MSFAEAGDDSEMVSQTSRDRIAVSTSSEFLETGSILACLSSVGLLCLDKRVDVNSFSAC